MKNRKVIIFLRLEQMVGNMESYEKRYEQYVQLVE